jgi:hypothetical protein
MVPQRHKQRLFAEAADIVAAIAFLGSEDAEVLFSRRRPRMRAVARPID